MENRHDEHFDDLLDRAAEALRRLPVPQGPPPEAVARVLDAARDAGAVPLTLFQRIKKMKRIARIAVAATLLVAVGALVSWMVIGGGSGNIAFARVAEALDSLRSATYDVAFEMKNPMNEKEKQRMTMKGLFLAPSRQRMEMSMGSGKGKGSSIMIMDGQSGKNIVLSAEMKTAIVVDTSKIKKPAGGPTDTFELVRRLVRQGRTGSGDKVESLGKKEIDGRAAVGFRMRSNMADMTLWADPQTARPVRIDMELPSTSGRGVMNNFRYDVALDPSLFSIEPPAGYTVRTINAMMPVEDDLVNVLRFVAEHNGGTFPAAIGMNGKEFMQAVQAASKAEAEKLLKEPETQKRLEKLKAQYGKDKDGFRKAWMKEWMKMIMPLTQTRTQKHMQGVMFYSLLKSENDSHYVGGGVKLGTPGRAILWYKPTGAAKYRVIYADLSVKDLSVDEVRKLPPAGAK